MFYAGQPTSYVSYSSFSEPALSPTPPHTWKRSALYVPSDRQLLSGDAGTLTRASALRLMLRSYWLTRAESR
jgi:hypothetical protein